MAQQPNVEITEAEQPRRVLEPGPAVDWRSEKPGIPYGPGDVPQGGRFGTTGPDPGWGVKIVNRAELPDDDPRLRKVVTGLALARAAAAGRAPVPEDIEVALALCGYGVEAGPEILERRKRWLEATAHESRSGETAVAEVSKDLLLDRPDQVRFRLRRAEGV